jgi:hypothetical protein
MRLEVIDARTGKSSRDRHHDADGSLIRRHVPNHSRVVEPELPPDGPPADPLLHDSQNRMGETTPKEEPPAVHDRLLSERLLHYSYKRQPRVLELRTPKSTIRVELAAPQ